MALSRTEPAGDLACPDPAFMILTGAIPMKVFSSKLIKLKHRALAKALQNPDIKKPFTRLEAAYSKKVLMNSVNTPKERMFIGNVTTINSGFMKTLRRARIRAAMTAVL